MPRNPHSTAQSDYQLGIDPYVKGLVDFLRGTTTPMTVALQGEWGSGKTSLMYKLQEELCGESGAYDSVWINTWEYSLMADSSQALLQIIAKMAASVGSNTFGSEKAKNIIGKLAKGVVKTALGITTGDTSIVDAVTDVFTSNGDSTVGQLQEELRKNIENRFEHSDKRGIIFFIDDLDRLNPDMAVELLELLKNIFTLNRCVFILAIDYDVVVKGLKGKFGDLTDQNEREFRSFFDKIIQVPFAMPVSNYKPESFIISSLLAVGYVDKPDTTDKNFVQNIMLATKNTVGNNPRSIKRLMNILSLVKCIAAATESQKDWDFSLNHRIGRFVTYVVMAIQVQYPKISRMLSLKPDFTSWDTDILKKFNARELSEDMVKLLRNNDASDEPWEQALYSVCDEDTFLKSRFLEISELLNLLRKEIEYQIDVLRGDKKAEPPTLGEIMRNAVQMSAVTSFSAGDTNPVVVDDNAWRSMVYKFHGMVSERLRSNHPKWKFVPRRNTGNGGFNFTEPEEMQFAFYRKTDGDKLVMEFYIYNGGWNRGLINTKEFAELNTREEILACPAVKNLLESVDSYMELLMQKNDWIQWSGLMSHHNNPANFGEGQIIHAPWFNFRFTDIESFTDRDNVRIISDIISKMVEFEMTLWKLFDTDHVNIEI